MTYVRSEGPPPRYPPPQPPRVTFDWLPQGYPGAIKTIDHARRLILEGVRDFYVRQKAVDILLAAGVPPKDYVGEIEALFRWVQRNVRYTRDPFRLELLHSPRRMLQLRSGDCDDMTILLATLLTAVGHWARLVLVGFDRRRPKHFSHVYLEVHHKGRWVPLDPTMVHPPGWQPRWQTRQVCWLHPEDARRAERLGAPG